MLQNGAALHPRDGGKNVAAGGGEGEQGCTGCNKGGLGVVPGELKQVDVAVSVLVIP